VTDNASAMIKACELLRIKNLPCFAHTVNLVVQDSIKFECVKEIVTKCKTIVTFFKSSSTAMEKFKIEQNTRKKPRTLIQEVSTRWNSMFALIKRILETNEAICNTLLNTRKAPQPLTADDILILKDLEKLLNPFDEITKRISGTTYVTISLIIPLTLGIYMKILDIEKSLITTEAKIVCQTLILSIKDRLFLYETRSIPRLATVINPRFKKEGFRSINNAEETIKFLESEMNTFSSRSATSINSDEEKEKNTNENSDSLLAFLEDRLSKKNRTVSVFDNN